MSKEEEFSDDELDELFSDHEDVKPTLSDPNTLLRGSLQRPRHVMLNTKHLHDLIHTGDVDLNAAYQRDVVWSEAKMIGLIQSLFLNYYTPPLIFAVEVDPVTGMEQRICIDGKQRCTSILDFIDGKIPFVSRGTKEKFWYTKYGNHKSGKQLPDSLKRKFEQISLQGVEYDGIKDEQQRDIFQRVQMGVALSAPEKLQAIPGPWPEWILELQKKYVTEQNTLAEKIDWDVKRAKPFQALTAFVMLAYEPIRMSQPTYSSMTKFLERSDPPDPHFRRKVEMALSLFVNIATNFFAEAFKTTVARVAPVEFWFIALLIYSRMGCMSLDTLAYQIGRMRSEIRAEHKDVRANGRVMKDLHTWLSKLPKKRKHEETVAAEEFEGDDIDERERRALKRSRKAEDEDPSYLGGVVPRHIDVDARKATRTKIAAPASTASRPARLALPTDPPARPPRSAMDAPASADSAMPAVLGQPYPNVSPYGPGYPVASSANKLNPNNQQQTAAPYSPYHQPTQQPSQYTPQQLLQLNAMRQAVAQKQQRGNSNQWAGTQ